MKITEVYIDSSGRMVLPKKARELCRITPDEPLEVLIEGCRIVIQPAKKVGGIISVEGIAVFSGEGSFSAQEALDQARLERDDHISQQHWTGHEKLQESAPEYSVKPKANTAGKIKTSKTHRSKGKTLKGNKT